MLFFNLKDLRETDKKSFKNAASVFRKPLENFHSYAPVLFFSSFIVSWFAFQSSFENFWNRDVLPKRNVLESRQTAGAHSLKLKKVNFPNSLYEAFKKSTRSGRKERVDNATAALERKRGREILLMVCYFCSHLVELRGGFFSHATFLSAQMLSQTSLNCESTFP